MFVFIYLFYGLYGNDLNCYVHAHVQYHASAVYMCTDICRGVWGLLHIRFSLINDQMDTIFYAGGCMCPYNNYNSPILSIIYIYIYIYVWH